MNRAAERRRKIHSRAAAEKAATTEALRLHTLARLRLTASEMGVMAVAGSAVVLLARLLLPAPEYVWLRVLLLPLTALFGYAVTRATTVRQYGMACLATIATVSLNAYLGVLGTDRPLMNFLPAALVVMLSTSFFWITLAQWIGGALVSYALFVPLMLFDAASRADTVFALLYALPGLAVGLVSHQRIQDFQRRAFEQECRLAELAVTDPLTGARSRRDFLQQAEEAAARAQASGAPLVLLYLDIDHFKRLNDRHGHAAGDEVLRAVGGVLQRMLRHHDVFGRLGGEEFCVLLPDHDEQQALAVSGRLRALLAEVPRPDRRLTVSAGIARLRDDETVAEALNRADLAMLEAKQGGRDRVLMAA
ncbi:GGDEF domain-containing protein [Xylophilus sp. GOD-11R]|uniref:GGDEF domain-containing protein n=1 Tax=Xylophilus sp. GOD-11R TaxID=3089814 RepID=UPI00298BDC96|nr:GGDEF domain-containing protein [Xylophilus sp. GOD-11R]WPB56508.1 GGDEF domain-containing protein [Xylophilus sp. GOD-11R]